MAAFQLTPDAVSSLKEIAVYTERKWGEEKRNSYLQQLDQCFHQLAEHPALGRMQPEIHPELRSYPSGKHVIYYMEKADFIAIINILHERMEPRGKLRSQ